MTPTIPPAGEAEGEVLHEELVAVPLRHPVEDHHLLAQPLRLRDEDLGGADLLLPVPADMSSS
jgi:hypothetical protein